MAIASGVARFRAYALSWMRDSVSVMGHVRGLMYFAAQRVSFRELNRPLAGLDFRGCFGEPAGRLSLEVGVHEDESPPLLEEPRGKMDCDGGFSDSPLGIG